MESKQPTPVHIPSFIWAVGDTGKFSDARIVRRAVFVQEQGYSLVGEFDKQDATSHHIIGYVNQAPVCTARMFFEASRRLHVGRVAVQAASRGKGYGLAMMEQIMLRACALGASILVLNAQSDKTRFYEMAGFVPTGNTSLDEGQPHTEMLMNL